MAERNAFVCGYPIKHSRSPVIHGYWLKQYGIAGSYRAIEVTPGDFPEFLAGMARQGLVGGNITLPHKQAALDLVDEADAPARKIGAVNTVWLEGGRLRGTNTDWLGFAASMDASAPGWDRAGKAVILGAGGAARGILYALASRGMTGTTLVNRTVARASALAEAFAPTVGRACGWDELPAALAGADLVINTTSVGMDGGAEAMVDLDPVAAGAIVSDIVYVPLETPLLREARIRDLRIVDGLGMLLHQAAPGFERWFGVRPQVTDSLRQAVLDDLVRAS